MAFCFTLLGIILLYIRLSKGYLQMFEEGLRSTLHALITAALACACIWRYSAYTDTRIQIHIAINQQRQERRKLRASKHGCKHCRITNMLKIHFADVLWGKKMHSACLLGVNTHKRERRERLSCLFVYTKTPQGTFNIWMSDRQRLKS